MSSSVTASLHVTALGPHLVGRETGPPVSSPTARTATTTTVAATATFQAPHPPSPTISARNASGEPAFSGPTPAERHELLQQQQQQQQQQQTDDDNSGSGADFVPTTTATTTAATTTLNGVPTSTMSVGDGPRKARRNGTNAAATSTTTTTTTTSTGATTSITVSRRQVRTGRVNCRWLYNQVQAARGMILIDTRPRAAYDDDTIPSAISIPPMADCRCLADVEEGMLEAQRFLFSAKRRKLRDVVLFGDAMKLRSTGSPTHADRCYPPEPQHAASQTTWLQHLERLIVEDGLVTSVKVLMDGFLTFRYRYPFFTTGTMLDELLCDGGLERTHSGTHNLNYPNEILEGFLFLGNMWHAQSKQVIKRLGITHVVNASLDIENCFQDDGVLYHEVKIKDRPEADIAAFFDTTFAFIESAKRTQHGRVLVHCTQGISRSATLVIMYLMRAHQLSLVTAVNFALNSRGVVYPNQGFMRQLMQEEFRLYRGNSLTPDEVDTLLQHQIPDRPIPLQTLDSKSENCSQCRKLFGMLEWKHRCSYCRKEFCSKCTSIRLAVTEREKESSPSDEARRGRRVCDCCVSRLWKINLPKPRKGLHLRFPRCKHLNVKSMSTFGTVCISYFEGTEPQTILDVIMVRFEVKDNQIIDISTDAGDPVRNLALLPDEAVVWISIGKTGNVQDAPQRFKNNNGTYGRRYQMLRNEAEAARIAQIDHLQRSRVSSEGNIDNLLERVEAVELRRSNSLHLEKSSELLPEPVEELVPESAQAEAKFRELWQLSFPAMGIIDRADILKIQDPMILTDLMLGMSSVSCGALNVPQFKARLIDMGYTEVDRDLVVGMLEQSLETGRN